MSNFEPRTIPRRRYSLICTSAVVVAVASGTFALVAMLVGPPRAFGLALVLCGAAWIVVYFVERLARRAYICESTLHAAELVQIGPAGHTTLALRRAEISELCCATTRSAA